MKFLTTQEAADQIRETAQTVADHCHTGRIKASRMGRGWRIRQSDLDAFMDSRVPVVAGKKSTIERGL